ncbi:Nucleolar complex protein 4 [Diplonema papillatum]|nr:Nucleolar complex protein 4 [Diplonema papillatum]
MSAKKASGKKAAKAKDAAPATLTLATALKGKNREAGFAAVAAAVLQKAGAAAGSWTEFNRYMTEEFGAGCVEAVLALPLVAGEADPVVGQLRAVLEEGDDLKYYAFQAGHQLLIRQLSEADEPEVGSKRKASALQPARPSAAREAVMKNMVALFHKIAVPTKAKGAGSISLKFDGAVRHLAALQKQGVQDADASSRKRNKKSKEGALQLTTTAAYQRVFTDFWTAVFHVDLLDKQSLLVLLDSMHEDVFPFMSSPLVLFEFLSEAFESGGLAGVLSLRSLFVLMTVHGLEFPAFFDKLYTIFNSDICSTKYRHTFFDLMGLFLTSVGLSSSLVAAFAKKACRLSLHVPTPAVFFLVSLFKSLIVKNPQLIVLIHRTDGISAANDPYDADTPFPEKSHALESSCWEIEALTSHFNPTICQTANELKDELKQPLGGTIPLLQSRAARTYSRMINREILRELKGVPSTAYAEPEPFTVASKEPAAKRAASALASTFVF